MARCKAGLQSCLTQLASFAHPWPRSRVSRQSLSADRAWQARQTLRVIGILGLTTLAISTFDRR
jgi:hypothetical protein